MPRKVYAAIGGATLLVAAIAVARAATWVPIEGNVRLLNGTPICAMVLANGQYMFSCDGTGAYNLDVPLDANGQITLFSFADGFAPFSTTLGPSSFPFGVQMHTAAPNSPLITTTRNVECASTPNWVHITGTVESYGSQPLCAMALSNGQQMFTCGDSLGEYDLTVPVDQNGHVTVFAFADGFQPYSDMFIAPVCSGPQVSETCGPNNFTEAKYNAIVTGMTVDQVNQTIGCKYDPQQTVHGPGFVMRLWLNTASIAATQMIMVFFDTNGIVLPFPGGGGAYKQSNGF